MGQFEATEQDRTAVDSETGARIEVRSYGPSMEYLRARYSAPGCGEILFHLNLKDTREGPNAIVAVADIERMFRARGQTDVQENTVIVKHIFQGLAVIDRKWHLLRHTEFGRDYEERRANGIVPVLVINWRVRRRQKQKK